jgi:hypothetical protein
MGVVPSLSGSGLGVPVRMALSIRLRGRGCLLRGPHRGAGPKVKSMNEICKLLTRVGSYVWETDIFQASWQDAFWGTNYAQLRAIKQKYASDGL